MTTAHFRFPKYLALKWLKDDRSSLLVFLYCIAKAQYYEGHEVMNNKSFKLHVGQMVCGIQRLVDELGLSKSEVESALKRLVTGNYIERKGTPKGSIITILNFSIYQGYQDTYQNQNMTQNRNRPETNNKQNGTIKYNNNDNKRTNYSSKASLTKDAITDAVASILEEENHG